MCFNTIHFTGFLTLAEIILISYIWANEVKDGIFNLKVSIWLFIVIWRMMA